MKELSDRQVERLPVDPSTRPDFGIFEAHILLKESGFYERSEDRADATEGANKGRVQDEAEKPAEENPQQDKSEITVEAARDTLLRHYLTLDVNNARSPEA